MKTALDNRLFSARWGVGKQKSVVDSVFCARDAAARRRMDEGHQLGRIALVPKILTRLGVHSRLKAVTLALRNGVIY